MFHYIKACKADSPALDTVNQCIRIHQRSTGTVDDYYILLHFFDSSCINHMLVVIGRRSMKRNHIGIFQKSIKIRILGILIHFLIFIEIIGKHLTAKSG